MSLLDRITKEAKMFIKQSEQQRFIEKQHLKAHIHGSCKCKKVNHALYVKFHLDNCLAYANSDPLSMPFPLSCNCRILKHIEKDEVLKIIDSIFADGSSSSESEISVEISVAASDGSASDDEVDIKKMCRCCRDRQEKEACCQKQNEINTKDVDDILAYIEGNKI
jgi:hypothetical protein